MSRCWLPLLALLTSGCAYGGLVRPSVLEQLEPPVVRLVNHLPAVDQANEGQVARIYATGGLTEAVLDANGVMRAEIWARPGQLIWTPAVIAMPQGGTLELTVHNPEGIKHAALLPSNGGQHLLELPPYSAGRMRVELDGPGLYWFGCPVMNHIGRNMLGLILVHGDTVEAARLDRPPQPRPAED